MPRGVIRKIAHDLREPIGIREDPRAGDVVLDTQRRGRLQAVQFVGEDIVEIDGHRAQGDALVIGLGQGEQIIDQPLHPGRFDTDNSAPRGIDAARRGLTDHPDRGQGAAQLMRGVADERALDRVHPVESVEHVVHRLSEVGDFVVAGRDRHAYVGAGLADPRDGGPDLLDATQGGRDDPAHQPEQTGEEDQGQRAQREGGVLDEGDLVLQGGRDHEPRRGHLWPRLEPADDHDMRVVLTGGELVESRARHLTHRWPGIRQGDLLGVVIVGGQHGAGLIDELQDRPLRGDVLQQRARVHAGVGDEGGELVRLIGGGNGHGAVEDDLQRQAVAAQRDGQRESSDDAGRGQDPEA